MGIKSSVNDVFCHQMPSSPITVEYNYLHKCDNGPIDGRVIKLTGNEPDEALLQASEI